MLNTDSRIEVHYAPRERAIRLLSGEAIFRVKHDAARPFRVISGHTVVQAVGTEFNVYRKEDATIVSVLEGRVAILSAPVIRYVDAGEQIQLNDHDVSSSKRKANMRNVASWRDRRLTFVDEPLSSIGEELNRYNRTLKILVEGDVARQLRYTAMLEVDDPQSLIAVLAGDSRVIVIERPGEIVVRSR